MRGGQAKIGVTTEPMIAQGIKLGLWSEPFFNVPKELGPYAYSTINVRLESIQKQPEVVRGFVRGMVKGLKFLYADKSGAADIAKKQFPTMALDDLKATLDRSFADEMWSKDGMISRAAWDTGKAVVLGAGMLKTDVKYDDIIDMSFVESVRASLDRARLDRSATTWSERPCPNRSGTSFSPSATRPCSARRATARAAASASGRRC